MVAQVADGTTFGRGDGASPEVFTTVAQVVAIGEVGTDRSLIDVTNLSSTLREYLVDIADGQEMQLELQADLNDAQHTGLRSDVDAGVAKNYRVTFPTSPAVTATITGIPRNWTVTNVSQGQALGIRFLLKPTASIVWA